MIIDGGKKMKKLIYLILLGLPVVAGCAGPPEMNGSSSEEYRQNRPNVFYQGTGISDPDSEL